MMLTVATCQPFIALRENWSQIRPPPWPIPFPPPQQVDTEPGKPPAMPHVAAPHCPSGIRPRGQHTGNSTGPEHAALPILRSSPAARLTEGEPRSRRTHHPTAPRSPHAGSLTARQNPPTPGPIPTPTGARSLLSQSRQTPPPSAAVLGTRPQGGHRSSYSTIKKQGRG